MLFLFSPPPHPPFFLRVGEIKNAVLFRRAPCAKPSSVPHWEHHLAVKILRGQAVQTGNRLPWCFLLLPTTHQDHIGRTAWQQSPSCLHSGATTSNNLLPLLGAPQTSTETDHHLSSPQISNSFSSPYIIA